MRLHDYLEFFARETPDHPCAAMDDRTLTYQEVDRLANRFANSLLAQGLEKGDRFTYISLNIHLHPYNSRSSPFPTSRHIPHSPSTPAHYPQLCRVGGCVYFCSLFDLLLYITTNCLVFVSVAVRGGVKTCAVRLVVRERVTGSYRAS